MTRVLFALAACAAVAQSASAAVVLATDFNAATVGTYADNTVINSTGANTSKVTARSALNSAVAIVDRGSGNLALQFTDNSADAALTANPRAYSNAFGPASTTATGENRLTGSFDYTRLLSVTSNGTSPSFQFLVSSGGATTGGSGTAAIQLSVEASGQVNYLNGTTNVVSPLTLTPGTEYTFAVDADFSSSTQDTWSLKITPVGSLTPALNVTGLGTRAPNVAPNIISFTGGANAGAVNASPFAQIDNLNFSTSAVPEPTTLGVIASGGVAMLRRRRSRQI